MINRRFHSTKGYFDSFIIESFFRSTQEQGNVYLGRTRCNNSKLMWWFPQSLFSFILNSTVTVSFYSVDSSFSPFFVFVKMFLFTFKVISRDFTKSFWIILFKKIKFVFSPPHEQMTLWRSFKGKCLKQGSPIRHARYSHTHNTHNRLADL